MNLYKKAFKLLIIVIILGSFGVMSPAYTFAETHVSGVIDTNTIWTLANSPYVVDGDVNIASSTTLTIEAGVIVKFSPFVRITIDEDGTISAIGTSTNKIYFTSLADDEIGGDTNGDGNTTSPNLETGEYFWGGIYSSLQNSSITLNNATVQYAERGLSLKEANDVQITDSIFEKNFVGIEDQGKNSVNILNSEIMNNNNGISIFQIDSEPNSTYAVSSLSIHGNNYSGVSYYILPPLAKKNSNPFIWFANLFKTKRVIAQTSYTVDFRNTWWGDASGPHSVNNSTGLGDVIEEDDFFDTHVLVDPWLTTDPFGQTCTIDCFSNVAFIPGLQASRLALGSNRLWEPNRHNDVRELFLDNSGASINTEIYTEGIIDEAFGANIYNEFIDFMDEMVTDEEIEEWQSFPYDWRMSVEDVIENPIALANDESYDMLEKLEELATDSPTGKVTIIAHSNGGLIAKLLVSKLQDLGKVNLVDKIILVAVPQTGTPKAIASILHGDGQVVPEKLGFFVDREHARELGENMPSAYTLLPSLKYFADVLDPVIEFGSDVDEIYDFQSLYGSSINSRSELEALLLGDDGARTEPTADDTDSPNVLDEDMLADASTLQNTLDSWTPPSGIEVVQIVGWGLDTIRGIRYDDCDIIFCPDNLSNLDRKLIMVRDGDGTVVTPSATSTFGANTYYINLPEHNQELGRLRRNREHADILEVESLQELIEQLLTQVEGSLPTHVSISKPSPVDENDRLRFRIHSPVSLDLYDEEGNHTGLIPNPDPDSDFLRVEANIPNSYYLEFGEVKYAGSNTLSPTEIVLIGEDTGTFTLEIEELEGDTVVATKTFTDVPVIENAKVTTEVADVSQPLVLAMDVNNDGITDATIQPGAGVTTEELLQILRGVVKTLNIPPKNKVRLDKIFDRIEKNLVKEEGCADRKKPAKCELRVKGRLENIITRLTILIDKFFKKGIISQKEKTEIMQVIISITNSLRT